MKNISTALLALILGIILLAWTAHALNLWMSNSIIEKTITVNAGYRGPLMHGPTNPYEHSVTWGTFDNKTYTLEMSVTGNASRFFRKLKKKAIIGPAVEGDRYANSYKYEAYLRIPKRTRAGNYTFNICGKVTTQSEFGFPTSLSLCTGDKTLTINGRSSPKPRKSRLRRRFR